MCLHVIRIAVKNGNICQDVTVYPLSLQPVSATSDLHDQTLSSFCSIGKGHTGKPRFMAFILDWNWPRSSSEIHGAKDYLLGVEAKEGLMDL